ncbi:MAG: hypothetical protein M1318_03835 [Firmicutes bacterium]|jgi:hypothetical protein|nr:hypothetical protein [Bacillota bacterium]
MFYGDGLVIGIGITVASPHGQWWMALVTMVAAEVITNLKVILYNQVVGSILWRVTVTMGVVLSLISPALPKGFYLGSCGFHSVCGCSSGVFACGTGGGWRFRLRGAVL